MICVGDRVSINESAEKGVVTYAAGMASQNLIVRLDDDREIHVASQEVTRE